MLLPLCESTDRKPSTDLLIWDPGSSIYWIHNAEILPLSINGNVSFSGRLVWSGMFDWLRSRNKSLGGCNSGRSAEAIAAVASFNEQLYKIAVNCSKSNNTLEVALHFLPCTLSSGWRPRFFPACSQWNMPYRNRDSLRGLKFKFSDADRRSYPPTFRLACTAHEFPKLPGLISSKGFQGGACQYTALGWTSS